MQNTYDHLMYINSEHSRRENKNNIIYNSLENYIGPLPETNFLLFCVIHIILGLIKKFSAKCACYEKTGLCTPWLYRYFIYT